MMILAFGRYDFNHSYTKIINSRSGFYKSNKTFCAIYDDIGIWKIQFWPVYAQIIVNNSKSGFYKSNKNFGLIYVVYETAERLSL